MNNCENCQIIHDCTYASGRFCSCKCARGFSTKNKRSEINKNVSKSLLNTGNGDIELICKQCNIGFIVDWRRRYQLYCSVSCSSKNKSIVINDGWKLKIKNSTLKSYKNGKNVHGGRTKWYQYNNIKVQGTYELRMCNVLDSYKINGIIKNWEYTNDRISYLDSHGNQHNYLIDFKVFNNDNTFYYLEVKGYKTDLDQLKWDSVKNMGYELKIFYNKDIISAENSLD